MRVPTRLRAASLLTALAVWWVPALAQTKARTWELGGTITFTNTDSQTTVQNGFSPSLLVGYTFTPRHGAEVVLTRWSASEDKGPALDLVVSVLRLGYTYNAYPREKVISFFRFGAGFYDLDVEELEDLTDVPERLQEDESHVIVYGGGGVRFFLNNWLAVRAAGAIEAINSGNGISNSDVQGTGDLGLVIFLGGRDVTAPEERSEEPPAEETKPAEGEKKEDAAEEKPPSDGRRGRS